MVEVDKTKLDDLIYNLEILKIALNLVKYDDSITNMDDIEGFACSICKKIVKSIETTIKVCYELDDFVAGCSLCRMLVDNVAILKLIYGEKNKDRKIYRHYLYVYDSLYQRFSKMPKTVIYDGKVSIEEYYKVQMSTQECLLNDAGGIGHCLKILNSHRYAAENPEFHKQSIEKRNWKFKRTEYCKKIKDNKYTWEEMYGLITGNKRTIDFFSSHLSQYVHGLGLSNTNVESDIKYSTIVVVLTVLVMQIAVDLYTIFPSLPKSELFKKS